MSFLKNVPKFSLFSVEKKQYYKSLRIYNEKPYFDLMSQIFINELCRHEIFVRNSLSLYNISRKFIGIFVY